MKVIFLFRSSFDSAYILSKLKLEKTTYAVVIESGRKAKLKKLRRYFRKANLLRYPVIITNLLSILIYSYLMERKMKGILGDTVYPRDKIHLEVDDANDEQCIEFIQQYHPDIVFVYGTALLGKTFLERVHATVLNIHSGILPNYRNVHSDFWAYINKDFSKIGISIFFLDEGIDSGSIALQKVVPHVESDRLADIKIKNLSAIPELISRANQLYREGKLSKKKQITKSIGFYSTPTAMDLLKFFKLEFFV